MTDYAAVLVANYPGAQWSLSGNDYDTLEWYDDTPKPSQAELDACLLYTSPSPRDGLLSRMPSSA